MIIKCYSNTKNLSTILLFIRPNMNHFKIFIDSSRWKCSSNLINWSRLHRYLTANGHTIIQDPEESDYIIINSCGAINKAKNRTLTIVQKYLQLKENHTSIILFGCLVDIDNQVVDTLDVKPIGLHDGQKLDAIFYQKKRFEDTERYCEDKIREVPIGEKHSTTILLTDEPIKTAMLNFHQFFLSVPLLLLFPSIRKRYHQIRSRFSNTIYVEISKGCNGNCNYCLVKRAKGKVQSRDIQDILRDIEKLYIPFKELCLVADDCGCYGVDKGSTIIQLLDSIHEKFPDIRLRLNYIDPRYFVKYSQDFLRIFQIMNIVSTIIPLQSGSQKILKKMNRSYDDATKVIDVLKKIRKVSPKTIFISQFIIGHPGEIWKDYLKTLAVARFFDYPVPIEYSNNKGTVSATMIDQVSQPIRSLRYAMFIIYLNVVVFFRIVDTMKKH
jgi:ribosomal protein S12 methylthiotransferase